MTRGDDYKPDWALEPDRAAPCGKPNTALRLMAETVRTFHTYGKTMDCGCGGAVFGAAQRLGVVCGSERRHARRITT